MCDTCGRYKGRQVVDVMAKIEKRNERMKAKARALGKEVETSKEEKTLSAETLSKKSK